MLPSESEVAEPTSVPSFETVTVTPSTGFSSVPTVRVAVIRGPSSTGGGVDGTVDDAVDGMEQACGDFAHLHFLC